MTDRWDEHLRCPRCRKIGMASLLQDRGDDMPTVDRVSGGFRVVRTEYGPAFECGTCNVSTDP
jgi:hypothetical protein